MGRLSAGNAPLVLACGLYGDVLEVLHPNQ
jgi:hypothetical protein